MGSFRRDTETKKEEREQIKTKNQKPKHSLGLCPGTVEMLGKEVKKKKS